MLPRPPTPLQSQMMLLACGSSGSGVALLRENLIAEYKLDEGSGSTAANAITATGGGDLTLTGSPSWVAAGVDCQGSGDRYMTGAFPSTVITTMTCYVAFRWPAAATGDSSNNGLFCGDNQNIFHLKTWVNGTTPWRTPGFRFGGTTCYPGVGVCDMKDDAWHVLTGVYDDSEIRFYIDDLLVATTTAAIGNVTLASLTLAALSDSGFGTDCIVGYAMLYSVAHSTAQVKLQRLSLQQIMAGRGVSMPPHQQCFVQIGDSISSAITTTVLAATSSKKLVIDRAVPGTGIADFVADSANVDDKINSARTNILVVWGMGNDITSAMTEAQVLAKVDMLDAYCEARRDAGYDKIVLANLLPRNSANFNVNRAVANAAFLQRTFYDVLADVAGDATIGPDAAAANATYYYDGTHLTAAANAIAAPIIATAIEA